MNGRAEELRVAARKWADDALEREDGHPSLAALEAYAGGEEADAERLRDHLAVCPECAALVLDLEAFPATWPAAGAAPLSSEELAADWARLAPNVPAAPRAATPRRERARRVVPGWLPWTLAASFAGLFVLAGLWGLEQQRARRAMSQAPETAVYLVEVDAVLRGGDEEAADTAPFEHWLELHLNLGQRLDPGEFELEIARAGGAVVERRTGLEQEEDGTFSLRLPPERLQPGTYELRLVREDDPQRRAVVRFELTITRT